MAPSFSGFWVLDKDVTPSQKDFMKKGLLRYDSLTDYKVSVIDNADEELRLFHFRRTHKVTGRTLDWFEKKARLFLRNKYLNFLAIFGVDLREIVYEDVLYCNGQNQEHPKDGKGFGKHQSLTEMRDNGSTMRITWVIPKLRGVLQVDHRVNTDNTMLTVTMSMRHTTDPEVKHTVTKMYRRSPWRPEDHDFLCTHPQRAYLV